MYELLTRSPSQYFSIGHHRWYYKENSHRSRFAHILRVCGHPYVVHHRDSSATGRALPRQGISRSYGVYRMCPTTYLFHRSRALEADIDISFIVPRRAD